MFQAFDLSYEHDPRTGPVFENLDLHIGPGEVVGIVGSNGCGKSTLLRLFAGDLGPRTGRIVGPGPESIAYLAQDRVLDAAGTLEDYWADRLEDLPRAKRLAARLGLPGDKVQQAYRTLSLGEQMRAELALLLAGEPSLLLLDEPTNHLDLPARDWLGRFLAEGRQTVLMVCHDRALLDACAHRVYELERGVLREYAGGYSDMAEAKRLRIEAGIAAHERHQQETRRLKNLAERALQTAQNFTKKDKNYDKNAKGYYRAIQNDMNRRAMAIRTRVERAISEDVEKPFVASLPKIAFPCGPIRSAYALQASQLAKSYGGRVLFEELTFSVEKGARLAIVGPNGSGKTTLLRLLLGEEAPDSGDLVWGSGVAVGTLSQGRADLDLARPAVEHFESEVREAARSLLSALGMDGNVHGNPTGTLSSGERTKLELVRIVLGRANVLVLDEPTNHLDIPSLEALEQALAQFPGAVIFTSHDRAFVEHVASDVLELGS